MQGQFAFCKAKSVEFTVLMLLHTRKDEYVRERERGGGNERERGSCRGPRFIKEMIMQYASLTPISAI